MKSLNIHRLYIPLRLAICIAFSAVSACFAQTTNSIPANLFLTDDERLFWYRPSGERLVNVSTIKAAQELVESRPAEQDPEGNWGAATNGFQLSLRSEKTNFTNSEPVIVTLLMRNVTTQSQTYVEPIDVVVTRNGNQLKRKDANGMLQINRPPIRNVFSQTQRKYKENLTEIYDLTEGGDYVLQAISKKPEVTSQTVSISITTATK